MTGWLLLFALVLQAPGVTYTISWDPVPTPVQQTPVCTAPDTPAGCHEQVAGPVTSYKLLMGNTPGKHTFPVGVFPATQTSAPFIVQPTDPQTYYFVLKACAGEVCSVESAEVSTAAPQIDCTGAVVLAVGDWTRTGRPGDSGRVFWSLTQSRNPVVRVAVSVDGVEVPPVPTGNDLRQFIGSYFRMPAALGEHKIAVIARDNNGCEDGSSRPMTVTVK